MSLAAQAKVLRAIQEGTIARVGGDKEINVNVRVIAATNKNLLEEIEKGNFRLDLYHRLGVILIHNPTLNEREEDIPVIAEKFIAEICEDNGIPKKEFTKEGFDAQNSAIGALLVGEPKEIVDKIWRHSEALGGIERVTFQMDAIKDHQKLMKCIELMGSEMVPLLKKQNTI